jgi:hypothetical protein
MEARCVCERRSEFVNTIYVILMLQIVISAQILLTIRHEDKCL